MLSEYLSTDRPYVDAGFSTLSTDFGRIVAPVFAPSLSTQLRRAGAANSLTLAEVLGYNHAALRPIAGRPKEDHSEEDFPAEQPQAEQDPWLS